MKTNTTQDAVIYCRNSNVKQRDGEYLARQEAHCREYAASKGYNVVQTFRDEGISGTSTNCPGLESMLSFLKDHPGTRQHVVIIADFSRLARSLEVYLKLRVAIDDAGGRLESPSVDFCEANADLIVECIMENSKQYEVS